MAFPRILLALPLLAAGAFLPPLGPEPAKAPDGAVGMEHETFAVEEVTVHRGQSLLFVNDSRYMHILGPGNEGILSEEAGSPANERALMPTNDTYTLGPFNVVGTFNITCTMHPEMNIKVVVTE